MSYEEQMMRKVASCKEQLSSPFVTDTRRNELWWEERGYWCAANLGKEADAEIAALRTELERKDAALKEIAGCRGNFGSGIKLKERARAALQPTREPPCKS